MFTDLAMQPADEDGAIALSAVSCLDCMRGLLMAVKTRPDVYVALEPYTAEILENTLTKVT